MKEMIKEKKQRDWLTAWTILVLPGLFLFSAWCFVQNPVFSEVGDPTDAVNEVSVIYAMISVLSPLICTVLSLLYVLFAKKEINRSLQWKRNQFIFNILLSVTYGWIAGMIFL